MKKHRLTGIICLILTVMLSGYILLDTFLIQTKMQTNISTDTSSAFLAAKSQLQPNTLPTAGAENAPQSSINPDLLEEESTEPASEDSDLVTEIASDLENIPESEPENLMAEYALDTEYPAWSDENISVTLTEYLYLDTHIYVADVAVSSAEYLKSAFAENTYGRNVTDETSDIAAENNAILAVNGDYYGAQETGYVIRNGTVYRDTSSGNSEILCIYADGTMSIENTGALSAQALVDSGVWQTLSFGPGLLDDGNVLVSVDDEVGKARASNPRTAIGQVSSNHYLFVVSDGRTDESAGLSLFELAEFMQGLGAQTAYNLDGGGSSTMYYQGDVINNPTSGRSISERSVSDIVYIG